MALESSLIAFKEFSDIPLVFWAGLLLTVRRTSQSSLRWASKQPADPVRPPTLGVEEVMRVLILKKQLDIEQLFADHTSLILIGSEPEDNPPEPQPAPERPLTPRAAKIPNIPYIFCSYKIRRGSYFISKRILCHLQKFLCNLQEEPLTFPRASCVISKRILCHVHWLISNEFLCHPVSREIPLSSPWGSFVISK